MPQLDHAECFLHILFFLLRLEACKHSCFCGRASSQKAASPACMMRARPRPRRTSFSMGEVVPFFPLLSLRSRPFGCYVRSNTVGATSYVSRWSRQRSIFLVPQTRSRLSLGVERLQTHTGGVTIFIDEDTIDKFLEV